MKIKALDVYIQSVTPPDVAPLAEWNCTDIFNRGTRVGPDRKIACPMTDVFQCRFALGEKKLADSASVLRLLTALHEEGVVWSDVHVIWAEL